MSTAGKKSQLKKNVDATICGRVLYSNNDSSSSSNTYAVAAVHHLDFLALYDIFFLYIRSYVKRNEEKTHRKKTNDEKNDYV